MRRLDSLWVHVIEPGHIRAVLNQMRDDLGAAASRAGGDGAPTMVVAGKYIPGGKAPDLVAAGVEVVGENRLQDLERKRALVGDALAFDFIGHLQRRKVRDVMPLVRLVHSLDSVELAHEIDRRVDAPTRVLVEVNIGGEPSKYGILPDRLRAFVDGVTALPNLVLGGLMAMPPPHHDPERSRPYFARARQLAEELAAEWQGRHDFRDLSMGTSQDFLVAAEEGATMVRVGRVLVTRAQAAAEAG